MTKCVSDWREKERPLIHIKHNSTQPNSPLRPLPTEKQFTQTVNSQ
ncbi:MAG: hypothetical protein H6667_10600 [Ardenticatenaceae bacterium]|nr:hypothetical protein [Ardenticatenaceae bacterium]